MNDFAVVSHRDPDVSRGWNSSRGSSSVTEGELYANSTEFSPQSE